ncbi:ATP-binding protein [Actinokineospora globicatena]|uniref:ATP-binding protein n=1 Tax=Actinokineospora globicatena TaxID=103729 RepID=UPI0020A4DCFF|nr:ATP-binding protein [Actinokineospora globicatena]MCP2302827.1 hypothetical protein [Actinokineospora globicatena]GLW78790.1 hypothetical protein Aglo01_32720 [Actinokineospora globicatena]GLW84542.1 hypothetical protein Aglo02_21820 [Actinokineospora globicatena]
MTDRPPFNPFVPPQRHVSRAMVSLRPVDDPEHEEHYVDVCGSARAYERLTTWPDVVEDILTTGGYVLAFGESGCGKTALVNRCANWVRDALREALGAKVIVVDLRRHALALESSSVAKRIGWACAKLVKVLRDEDALVDPDAPELKSGDPDLILPELDSLLDPSLALVVLLPDHLDLVREVHVYASGMLSPRVLYLAESALLTDAHVRKIELELEDTRPPIVLRLRTLTRADVARFVGDRLDRHRAAGPYPGIDDTAVAELVATKSVKTLQRTLLGTFEMLRREAVNYSEAYAVTVDDLNRYTRGIQS